MTLCDAYKVAGKPLPAPDAGVEMTCADIDASDAGRDESGYMHRQVVRRRVRTWTFTYTLLTGEELSYIRSVFSGLDEFPFTSPEGECTAYCSNESFTVQNLALGLYRGCKFTVIEC